MENTITTETMTTEKPPFLVDTEEKANWVLSQLAGIEAEKERVKRQADKRLAELTADYDRLLFLFSGQLECFARHEAERRRRKTVTLLQGTLSFRLVPAALKVADMQDALTTAKAVLPAAIVSQTTESLDKAAFLAYAKERLDETGELLPGIERTTERETFSIKFAAGREALGKEEV